MYLGKYNFTTCLHCLNLYEHVHQLILLSLASFLYVIAVLIPMVMGRFIIDIYTISLFTSIREEQGLNMEAVYYLVNVIRKVQLHNLSPLS
jgi:hypothetical protein